MQGLIYDLTNELKVKLMYKWIEALGLGEGRIKGWMNE